jgi:hypothetical protein
VRDRQTGRHTDTQHRKDTDTKINTFAHYNALVTKKQTFTER